MKQSVTDTIPYILLIIICLGIISFVIICFHITFGIGLLSFFTLGAFFGWLIYDDGKFQREMKKLKEDIQELELFFKRREQREEIIQMLHFANFLYKVNQWDEPGEEENIESINRKISFKMNSKDIQKSNSVSLMFAFKVALDEENYLLCQSIKEELTDRKNRGELDNEIIDATIQAYNVHGKSHQDSHYIVFHEMLEEIKTI
ncbi:MAG: hypothetical protein ACK5KL_19420 [Dysgonomonas sp.]